MTRPLPKLLPAEAPVLDRACPRCNRFVKHDAEVFMNGLGHLSEQDNATCSKCGRVRCHVVDWKECES